MSPLLSARAPVSVSLRLLGACAVTALLAVVVAFGAGSTNRPTAAVPAALAVGCVCAALVGHLLFATARTISDSRLLWMSAGVTIAFAGLALDVLGQPSIFHTGGPVEQGPDATAARYLIWHVALLAAGVLAVAGVRARPRGLLAFGAAGIVLLLYASLASAPFGDLASSTDGYHAGVRTAVAIIAVGQLAVAAAWWRTAHGAPTWAEVCVIALTVLSGFDALSYLFATQPYENAWWASLTLRAGQFAVPAVGLVLGFISVADRLRDIQQELAAGIELERERALREEEITRLDRDRRREAEQRLGRLIEGDGLDIALQPIVDLDSGRVVGAEALARFQDDDGEPLATEETFLDAHALGLGVELELAEHQAVEDYGQLAGTLDRLRAHGVRVAIDDVGSGFASFRHVTRVNPEILKLDRSLVCGIDEDPVRQSLASAIVAFARDVGATVVSEGIESGDELSCLMGLAVGCGQGFYLGRPGLGRVESRVPELTLG